jgi:hypothetical protein
MARRKPYIIIPKFIAVSGRGIREGSLGAGQTPLKAYENLKERDKAFGYEELDMAAVTILKVEAYAKPELKLELIWNFLSGPLLSPCNPIRKAVKG